MKGLFNKSTIHRHKTETPVLRDVNANKLEEYQAGTSADVWMNDPIGTGLKNTQQLKVDWDDYTQHVFFNSAEAKVNLSFDQIINGYPFDGTADEKAIWKSQIGGFTNHILGKIETHQGYLTLDGTSNYLSFNDSTGQLIPELAKEIGKSKISKSVDSKGITFETWIRIPTPTNVMKPMVVIQKMKTATPQGFTCWAHIKPIVKIQPITMPSAGETLQFASTQLGTPQVITFKAGGGTDSSFSTNAADIDLSADDTPAKIADAIKTLVNNLTDYSATDSNGTVSIVPSARNANYNLTVTATNISDYTISTASSVPTTYDLSFMIASDNFRAGIHTIMPIQESGKSGLAFDTWHHVAFVYYRGSTEKISAYLNGTFYSSTTMMSELNDITLGDVATTIGWGKNHISHALASPGVGITQNSEGFLKGSLDELRLWLGTRTAQQIKENYLRNVDNTPELLVYFKFNEPPSSATYGHNYDAKTIILDSSGNSFHTTVLGTYADANRDPVVYNAANVPQPLLLEKAIDNVILFPDWPPTKSYNSSLLVAANHYDRNNPNLITKLIPRHYFEEAQFFEGIEDGLEVPLEMQVKGVQYPVGGHAVVPSRTVILTFLLTWANFFDDIKLFIDSVTSLDKVTYDDYNQIPPQMIMFLSEYYGIDLPNPFANENPARYSQGANLKNSAEISTPLSTTVDLMWRRILINLPFLLRSRGTIQGIKSLINTLGLQSDSLFRFREYGGSLTDEISNLRKRKQKRTGFLNFGKINYMTTPALNAYRHEPGVPDENNPNAFPTPSEPLFASGDIIIIKPGTGAPFTHFTSGSWAWEGRYQLLPTETTASLFRLEKDISGTVHTLVNLVAMRAPDGVAPDYTLKLFIDGNKGDSLSTDEQTLEIKGLNLWDGKPRYINVSSTWGDTHHKVDIRVIKPGDTYILEHHSGSMMYEKQPTGQVPWLSKTGTNHENIYLSIGNNSSLTRGTNYNQSAAAKTFNYAGELSHMRFWTKDLSRKESIEHAQNPYSVSTENPINNFTFPAETFNEMSSAKYEGTLPMGSWQRLRISYDMLQPETTFNGGTLDLIDTTQSGRDATLNGQNGGFLKKDILYSITVPEFDLNSASNKVRIRSYQDEETARDMDAYHGILNELPLEVGRDDRRFSIESSLTHALNEDIINVLGNSNILNNYLGSPELEYAVQYPELTKISNIYFKRLTDKVNYSAIIEFQRWFNNNFASLIESFVPYTADFLGINFVIESHVLERHKMEYKQGDVHVDIRDRQAFSQEPLIVGTLRAEIT